MKRIALFLVTLALSFPAFSQQCGLIPCPFPPTFTVGPAVQFNVYCTAPGSSFSDVQVFQATNSSTTVAASRIGSMNLSTMTVNSAPGHCFSNTRTHWEGCDETVATVPTYDYEVQVTGTVTCAASGNMPYWLQAQ
jgi:hypothetical protein